MPDAIQLDWIPGNGMPPEVEAPEKQKIFVYYRDVRQPDLDWEVLGTDTMSVFTPAHGGKYTFVIKSKNGTEYSLGEARESYIVDGTLADPGSAPDDIPTGVESIAAPEGLSLGPVA